MELGFCSIINYLRYVIEIKADYVVLTADEYLKLVREVNGVEYHDLMVFGRFYGLEIRVED